MFKMEIIPLLKDNYAYLLVDQERGDVCVVDPSEPEPVLAHLQTKGYRLVEIWNTHHHYDHVGGNEVLKKDTGCEVVASNRDRGRVPGQSRGVSEGDMLEFAGFQAEVLETPGHTLGAVTYIVSGYMFTGDTLFLAGCGRLFEGTPGQMWSSLSRLRALPGNLQICCGHEYTAANLGFAGFLEPENEAVRNRLRDVEAIRAQGKPSVPATMDEERSTNPFLRADDPLLVSSLARHHGVELIPGEAVFAWTRERKDNY